MKLMTTKFMHLTGKLSGILLAAFLLPATASAQKILRYSDHEPLGGMRTKFIKDVFFAGIEKESQGRLKVEEHWDSTVSVGYDALEIVGKGREADMAIVVPEYTANTLPLHQIFKSFPTGPTGQKQVDFFRRVYRDVPAFSGELAKNNVVPIFLATGYPVAFFSTRPLNTLNDIQGQTWRSASFWHKDFLQNAAATPVTIPWGEKVFDALQARTLDGLMVNVDSGYMLKVPAAAPHVLLSKDLWLGHLYILAMNRDTWNGLTKEDKAAIGRAAEIAYRALGPVMDSSFEVMVADIKKNGAQVRLLQPKELKAWEKAIKYKKVQASWVKEQESKGVKDAALVLKKVSAILSDATK